MSVGLHIEGSGSPLLTCRDPERAQKDFILSVHLMLSPLPPETALLMEGAREMSTVHQTPTTSRCMNVRLCPSPFHSRLTGQTDIWRWPGMCWGAFPITPPSFPCTIPSLLSPPLRAPIYTPATPSPPHLSRKSEPQRKANPLGSRWKQQ